MKKLFVFLLVVAIVGGLGYGVWNGMAGTELQQKFAGLVDSARGVAPPTPESAPGGDLAQKAGTTPGGGTGPTDLAGTVKPPKGTEGTKTPTTSGPTSATPAILAAAETVLSAAEKLYQAAEFKTAAEKLQPLVASAPDKKIGERAARLAGRARTCAEVLDDVADSERSSPENVVEVVLMSGNPMRGTLVSDTPGAVTIKRAGGIEFKISKSRVKEVVKLDQTAVRAALEAELAAQLKKRSAPTATDYYELALYCYKNRLDARVSELLEKALEKDPNLGKTLHHDKAKNMYEAYVWFTGRGNAKDANRLQEILAAKYSDTPYAGMVKETIEEVASATGSSGSVMPETGNGEQSGDGEPGPGPSLGSGSEQAREMVARANKLYSEGMEHFDRSEPGAPNRKAENQKAFQCFNEALNLYEEAYGLTKDGGLAGRLDQVRAIKVLTFRRQKALN